MSVWTWVLVGLVAAGILLALVSIAGAALVAMRVRRRIEALQNSRLATSLRDLQFQTERLAAGSARATPLIERSKSALASISASVDALKCEPARRALERTGAEISALAGELR